MDKKEDKRELRRVMLARRDGMSGSEAAALNSALWSRLRAYEALWDGRTVFTYISYRREADTRALIRALWEKKIPVAAPRVDGKRMDFYRILGEQDIRAGYKGIPEPADCCEPVRPGEGLAVVPGAVFDRRGYRVGYGGGYYDRFLEENPGLGTLGLAYAFQVAHWVPCEEFDRPVERIMTDSGLINCNRSAAKR